MTSALDSTITVSKRLAALAKFEIMDTPPERDFDDLVQVARIACHTSMAVIGFVDGNREWFKATYGLDLTESMLGDSFAAHVITSREVVVVPDATRDPRFCELSLVADHGVRFFAGAPLITRDGTVIGSLTIMNCAPRADFLIEQRVAMEILAKEVVAQLELRCTVWDLALSLCEKHAATAATRELRQLLPLCGECNDLRRDDEYWQRVEEYISAHQHPYLSHSICTECYDESSSPVSLRPQPYPKLLGSRLGRFAV